jgi:hypothetical protein
MWVTRAN